VPIAVPRPLEFDVVYSYDFAAMDIDNLTVDEVLLKI
jgi:hypothetical protein